MRYFLILLFAAVVFFIPHGPAFAADAPGKLPQEDIEKIGRAAHGLLPGARIGKGEAGDEIGEEKAKTLNYPLISPDMMEFIIVRGHIAGFASHCGLDWQKKFYMPMMAFLRDRKKEYTDYQWAYVGLLHGVAMGGAEAAVKQEVCTEDMKAQLLKEAK